MDKMFLRTLVESLYDLQKTRIIIGNRLVANTYRKAGLQSGEKKEDMEEDAAKILRELTGEYVRMTDGLANLSARKKIAEIQKQEGVISDIFEYQSVGVYHTFLTQEKVMEDNIRKSLAVFPLYTEFLDGVKGCGPLMSAVIISYFDVNRSRHVSGFYKYAGLDTLMVEDPETGELHGEARSNKAHHLIDVEYVAKDGTTKMKKSITYNPFLRAKLIGVLGSCFLKCNSPYREYYDSYKQREANDPTKEKLTLKHKHNRAIRFMIKKFILDLWIKWRELEGYMTEPIYQEAYLHHAHGDIIEHPGAKVYEITPECKNYRNVVSMWEQKRVNNLPMIPVISTVGYTDGYHDVWYAPTSEGKYLLKTYRNPVTGMIEVL